VVSPDPARAGVHRRLPHPRRAHLHAAHPPPNRSPCPPGPRGQRRGGSRTWRQRRRHRPGTGWITGHRPARGRRQARSRRHWGGLTFWNAATPSPPRSPTWPGSGTAVKTGRRARWLTSTRHARPDHDRPSCPRQDGLTRLHPGSLPPPSPCVTGVSAGTIARQARLAADEDGCLVAHLAAWRAVPIRPVEIDDWLPSVTFLPGDGGVFRSFTAV